MACGRTTNNFADGGKLAAYYPVGKFPSVVARLELSKSSSGKWTPSISCSSSLGYLTVDEARAFAAAIIEAADWCDKQGGK